MESPGNYMEMAGAGGCVICRADESLVSAVATLTVVEPVWPEISMLAESPQFAWSNVVRRVAMTSALSVLVACSRQVSKPPADTLWLLAADPSNDAVHATDSESSLRARYGDTNVVAAAISIGEGMTQPGAILFPKDSIRSLFIIWRDSVSRAGAAQAEIRGNRSRWMVYPGITLGTTLHDLERLNGGPFNLFGFDFDYSGTVESWNGRLDSLWILPDHQKLVVARLYPNHAAEGDSAFRSRLAGEHLFPSSDPAMQKLNPDIYDLFIRPR